MDRETTTPEVPSSWKFPRTFWFANGAELCERAAFYGMFITLMRYLNRDIGFTDPESGLVAALFAGGIYFLPTFMGIMADKIGFKQALMIAFALLSAGYVLLGAFQLKVSAVLALGLVMCGGAIIKPVISATAAKCSTDQNRARAMSIFYMVVNIGAFSGKQLAGYLNEYFGLQYINFYAAGMSALAFVLVTFFYHNVDTAGAGKSVAEALRGLGKVMTNFRFLGLILIVSGFWLIQGQLYGAMPTFVERTMGVGYKPEWLANINPLTVVILVIPINHLIRNFRPVSAIGVGLFIIPFTALVIALAASPAVRAAGADWSVPPLVIAIIVGIALQGVAECFLSPKFLEYASKQAPKGEEGLYLGYQHLTTFFAWLLAFTGAGLLLDHYCPDPREFEPDVRHQWRLATDPNYHFTLTDAQRADLVAEGTVPASIATAMREHGIELPADAAIAAKQDEELMETDAERTWLIAGGAITIKESKLEADADARAAGRDHALRDVLVLTRKPRPATDLPPLPDRYANADRIWYAFSAVGGLAFLALLVYNYVTRRLDRERLRQA